MSYQLISSMGKNEVYPRSMVSSAEIPKTLEQLLKELGVAVCNSITGSDELHFCYHIVDKWHILSAVKQDSAGVCRMHHMALMEEEVAALQKNNSRPTPAGVMQALLSFGFWRVNEELPDSPLREPRMTASHLPDASTQNYWKQFTGHKSNAMVLLTPPYLGKTLINIQPHVTQEDLLHLLHESMWLSASRGWGKTFRTFFSGKITDFDFADIAVTPINSAQCNEFRLAQHHVPILTLTSEMRQKETDADTRSSLILTSPPNPAPPIVRQKAPEFAAEPYRYVEAQDYETFDIKPPLSPHVRGLKYIVGLLTLTTIVYVIVSNYVDFASAPLSSEGLTTQEEQYAVHRFADTIRKGHYTEEQLQKIKATLQTDTHPRHAILAECIGLLTQGALRADGHADNLLYLLTHASVLEMTPADLWNCYLKIATKAYPATEWIALNTSPADIQVWQTIFKKYPQLKQAAQQDKLLRHYMTPVIQQATR